MQISADLFCLWLVLDENERVAGFCLESKDGDPFADSFCRTLCRSFSARHGRIDYREPDHSVAFVAEGGNQCVFKGVPGPRVEDLRKVLREFDGDLEIGSWPPEEKHATCTVRRSDLMFFYRRDAFAPD